MRSFFPALNFAEESHAETCTTYQQGISIHSRTQSFCAACYHKGCRRRAIQSVLGTAPRPRSSHLQFWGNQSSICCSCNRERGGRRQHDQFTTTLRGRCEYQG